VDSNGEILDALLLTQAQTAAFWGILFAHFGYLVSARSVYRSAFTFNPFANYWLLAGMGLSIAIRFRPHGGAGGQRSVPYRTLPGRMVADDPAVLPAQFPGHRE
jgi:hypothetical protein